MWCNSFIHLTKHEILLLYGVILFICVCNIQNVFGVKDEKVDISGKQSVLLRRAVRTLLGFTKNPTSRSRLLPNPDKLSEEAPQYMMDLYERFKNTRISKGHLFGNTVRSIQAEIAEVNDEGMFVFNLTSMKPNERLLSAEIHLYKKKAKKPWHRKRDVEMELFEIAPHYMTQNGKITMRAESFGWQWYDVTDAVSSCLAARRDTPHIFALNFKFEKPNGKVRKLALQKFIRHHSKPFLIVYSNDTQVIDFNELGPMSEGEELDGPVLPENLDSVDFELNTERTLSGDKKSEDTNLSDGQNKKSSVKNRKKRSIFNNEIPEDPADYRKFNRRFNKIPATHPGILQTRRESRHKLSDPQLIPYPDKKHRRKNRRKNRKGRKFRKKHGKRKRKNKNIFPKEWDNHNFDVGNHATGENSKGGVCSRRKLVVDFADISWGEWIISPKSFEAHYCSGSCPFPLTKRLKPTNHATIQSMVHAIGIYADVPAPCCVPDSMSSVTLLYFDENRNVVLKNYPSMTVNSCACR